MENKKISTKPQTKKSNVLLVIATSPQMISGLLTTIACHFALKSHFLPEYFNISIPHDFNFENKISILARIAAWISLILIFHVLSVIGARVGSKAVNPLKDQSNELVTVFNKILTNSIEQTLVFLPLLVNWVINCSNTDSELKQGVSLAIIWIMGRVIFTITYLIGYLSNYSVLRAYGFSPTIFPSVILALRFAGIKFMQ